MSDADEPTPSWAGGPGFHPDSAAPGADAAPPDATPPDATPPDATPPDADDEPVRPGYERVGYLPPHAPMPGAPPYPAGEAPPPVAPRGARRGFLGFIKRLVGGRS